MIKVHSIRRAPLAWFLKAAALGALVGLAMALLAGDTASADLSRSACTGVIFSLVLWAGFHCALGPFERFQRRWQPRTAGLATVIWFLATYVVLLGVVAALVRLILGMDLFRDRAALLVYFLAGLAVSGVMATRSSVADRIEAERNLARAEARAAFLGLRAQIQPHTLFNALNTIAALVHSDPDRAEEATELLAGLLRKVLGALELSGWSLEQEFALLGHLLRLEQLRFGERLAYRLDLDPAMAGLQMQPLLLLPLVENALKHGFRPKVGPCFLEVAARDGAILVRDDGVGRDPAAPEGVGLRTVRELLEAMGGRLRWLDSGPGCAVELRIPCP